MIMNLIEPDEKVTSVWHRTQLVKCLFCELPSRSTPLCSSCLTDPVQTRTAIYLQQHNLERQEAQSYAAWSQLAETHLAFWEKLLAGRKSNANADARARLAHPTYALLLDAEATYKRTEQALQAERDRLERAEQILREL